MKHAKMNAAQSPTVRIFALIALAAGLVVPGCTVYPPIDGSGILVEGTADFQDFSVVEASYGFEVTILQDDSYSITVTADDNVMEHVQMKQDGQSFEIGLDPWYSYRNVTVEALITMPVLSGIDLSGASSLLVVDGASFPPAATFEAELSGASSLMLPDITADRVDLELSGASTASVGLSAATVHLEVSGASSLAAGGSAEEIVADVSGASEADLRNLPGVDGELEVSGASRMWITMSGLVDADVSGGSTLYYRGGLAWGDLSVSGGSELVAY